MKKYRIIKILSFGALIPLICAFIFPFVKNESQSYFVALFWIWGVPQFKDYFFFIFPFIFPSLGMIVEIVYLLKSYFMLRKDSTKIEVVSRDWIKIGKYIIRFEFLWICLLFLVYMFYPFGIYYIEVPIFLPLIGGIMLTIAGNLSRRLDINNDSISLKESKFTTIHRLYIFVFILYSLFFLIFFVILIFPELYFNNLLFYYLLYGLYGLCPMLLTLLIMKFVRFLDNTKVNTLHEHKQLNKLYIMTLVIIGILILIYLLLNWMRPTIRILFSSFD